MPLIRIHSHSFQISDPYQAGRAVGPEERQALDRLRAENIRNNLAKQMDKIGWPLQGQELEAFEERVRQADQNYHFAAGGAERQSQFDKEFQAVLKDAAEQALRAAGHFAFNKDDLAEVMEELRSDATLQAEARRRLEAKKEAAREGLEEIL